jgi:hypothetical protein
MIASDAEYDAGFGAAYVATQAEVSLARRESRSLACRLLAVDPDQDQRTTYALWGAYKNDGRPPREAGTEAAGGTRR